MSFVPVGTPFVDILGDIVKSKPVWGPLTDALRSVQPTVKVTWLSLGRFVSPSVEPFFKSTSRCSFPFGFSGKTISFSGFIREPCAEPRCVEPADGGYWLFWMVELRIIPGLRSLEFGCVYKEAIETIGDCEAPYCELIYIDLMDRFFIFGAGVATH